MKYLKKKKRKGLIAAVVIACILLVLLLALAIWLERDAGKHGDEPTEASETSTQTAASTAGTEPEESTAPEYSATEEHAATDADALYHTGEIDTPYLTLYVDTAMADHLTVVHDASKPYRLEFYVTLDGRPEQRIFDILIGDGADGNLGMIESKLGQVPVSMVIYAFTPDESWTQDEINTVLAIQEISNDLMAQISALETGEDHAGPEWSTETPESNISEDMQIDTPYGVLHYPAEWEENLHTLQTEGEDYRVQFYGILNGNDQVLLFTLIFGGDHGEQLGVIRDSQGQYVTVNLLMEELVQEIRSENELTMLFAMQEAVNQLIDKLPLE